MKFLLLSLILAISIGGAISTIGFFSGWGYYLQRFTNGPVFNPQGGDITFPLCFPGGYFGPPNAICYPYGITGSVDNAAAGPCLPPVIGCRIIPPCDGPFIKLTSFNAERNSLTCGLPNLC